MEEVDCMRKRQDFSKLNVTNRDSPRIDSFVPAVSQCSLAELETVGHEPN